MYEALSWRAFHPDYGLFKLSDTQCTCFPSTKVQILTHVFGSTEEKELYPNPSSHIVHNHLEYLAFLGRMLGKAMFDGIQVCMPYVWQCYSCVCYTCVCVCVCVCACVPPRRMLGKAMFDCIQVCS